MTQIPPPPPPPSPPQPPPAASIPHQAVAQGRGCWFYGCLVALVLLLVILGTAAGTAWWLKRSMKAEPFETVELTETEEQVLERKLERLGVSRSETGPEPPGLPADAAEVETDEDFLRKPVIISEHEINGWIGKDPQLAGKVSVALDPDRIQVKANIPLPADVPLVGGTTLRLNLRSRLVLADQRMMLVLEDIAIGGIPIPNAWLQDVKGRDLLQELQNDQGLRTLIAGIEKLEIQDGQIVFIPAE